MFISVSRNITNEPPTTIDCPACGRREILSYPRQYEERLMLLYLIPLSRSRTILIDCGACRRTLRPVMYDRERWGRLSAAERSAGMRLGTSAVGKFCVVAAMVCFWLPFITPLIAIVGLASTWGDPKWRRFAILAVCLSTLITAIATAFIVMNPET